MKTELKASHDYSAILTVKSRRTMTGPAASRRNPPRRCRTSASNVNETLSQKSRDSDRPSEEKYQLEHENEQQRRGDPERHSDSDPSEYEASDSEEPEHDQASSSDFEEDNVKAVRPKRVMKPRNSNQRKRTKTTHSADGNNLTGDQHSVELSAAQTKILGEIFSEFDIRKNGRITLSDIRRVADDHAFHYGAEELRDMVRFWDTSGTITISRETFTKLAVEAKFMVPSSK